MTSSENRFQENLEAWGRFHPKEAIWLANAKLPAVETAEEPGSEWLLALPLDQVDTLYIYGVGSGTAFSLITPWLKENPERQLVFLEDDLGAISHLFQTEEGSRLLQDPQARLIYFRDPESDHALLSSLYWSSSRTPFAFGVHPDYQKKKSAIASELHQELLYDFALKQENLQEYLQHGFAFFRNYYSNLKFLPDALQAQAFLGKFQGVPAILCGAGPSLEKQLPLLKSLQDKALIFAGSSALNALAAHSISPHFGLGIDPNPAQLERIERLPSTAFPFFYRSRIYTPALEKIEGPRIFVPGSGGYDIGEWLEKELGIPHLEMEEGHNVLNFGLQLAQLLGCGPIILIGMDLAFTDEKAYAEGVLEENSVSHELDGAIERNDIHGKPVKTLWKWLTESRWISEFAKEHEDLVIVNATEGGIGFQGIPNQAFSEVAEEFCKESNPVSSRVNSCLQQGQIPRIAQFDLSDVIGRLKESLQNACEQLETLIEETKLSQKLNPDQYEQSGLAALAEIDLSEEPAFEAVLSLFNTVFTKLAQRELERIQPLLQGRAEALYRINLRKYEFLLQTAKVNLSLLKKIFP